MKLRKLTALLMGTAMVASLLAGCGSSDSTDAAATTETEQTTDSTEQATDSTEQAGGEADSSEKKEYADDEIIDMTMFTAMPGSEINDGNEIQEIIAKKTGVFLRGNQGVF